MLYERTTWRADMIRCTLCKDALCSAACSKLDPAGFLRSIWFDNEKVAAARLPEENPCLGCDAPCEAACVRARQIPIRALMLRLYDEVKPELEVPLPRDEGLLTTDLCGVPLENPFLLSSSVVASTYDMCARAFEAGWAGACFKTICSFDIHEASPRFSAITGDNGAIIGFKNIEQLSDHSVAENMDIFRQLKKNYPTKFILASIMGQNEAEWEELSRLCEENGADAIELNFSCPNMMDDGLGSDIGQVPELVERFTAAARRGTKIPILAKLTPNVAAMSPAAEAAKRGGADGIAAINTIKSIIGVNPHTYVSAPPVHGMSAVGGYSGNAVKPIALRFIAELAQNRKLAGMHLSATGLAYYLAEKGFSRVGEARGLALDSVSDTTEVLERDTVIFPKFHRERCIGCGRCVISCADGGHQAIRLDENRRPLLNGQKCVGCHLCVLVCPQKAIKSSRKRIKR